MYSFFNLVNRWGWVVNATPWQLYPRERPGTPCTEAGWATGRVLTGAENLASTSIRFPERPASRYTDYSIPAYATYNLLQSCAKNKARHPLPDSRLLPGALHTCNKTLHERPTGKQLQSVTAH